MATERVERKLAAILAADVVGYSRLIGVGENSALQALKAILGEVFRPTAAYGANYERLVGLTNKYDPTNLFRHNQNIKPTV